MKLSSRSRGLELRHSTDDFVNHRRATASLALVSMGSLAVVALYQLGVFDLAPVLRTSGCATEEHNRYGNHTEQVWQEI